MQCVGPWTKLICSCWTTVTTFITFDGYIMCDSAVLVAIHCMLQWHGHGTVFLLVLTPQHTTRHWRRTVLAVILTLFCQPTPTSNNVGLCVTGADIVIRHKKWQLPLSADSVGDNDGSCVAGFTAAPSLSVFKRQLITFLFDNSFSWLYM